MKRMKFAVAIICTVVLSTLNLSAQDKSELKTDIDSVLYAFGTMFVQGELDKHLADVALLSPTYGEEVANMSEEEIEEKNDRTRKEYIEGFVEGMSLDKVNEVHALGLFMGNMVYKILMSSLKELELSEPTPAEMKLSVAKGLRDALNKRESAISDPFNFFTEKLEKMKSKQDEKQNAGTIRAGEKYMAANAKRKGVVSLDNGVQYEVLKMGSGEMPTATSRLKIEYSVKTIDGTELESGVYIHMSATQKSSNYIENMREVFYLMPMGSIWKVIVPGQSAYDLNSEMVPAYSTLVFDVELIGIE